MTKCELFLCCCLFLGMLPVISEATVTQATSEPAMQNDKAADQKAPDSEQKKEETAPPSKPNDPTASREEERQAKIVADTNKLYDMVQELKAEVAKSSKDTLSVSVVKKAAEIEKLAKSLKERMRAE